MKSVFSAKEKQFIHDIINGDIKRYKRSYACRLRQRTLLKAIQVCEDLMAYHKMYIKEYKKYSRFGLNDTLSRYQRLIQSLHRLSLTPWSPSDKDDH